MNKLSWKWPRNKTISSIPARIHRTAGEGFYTCADTKRDTELAKIALLEEKQEKHLGL